MKIKVCFTLSLLFLFLFSVKAWGADPYSATYSHDSSKVFWIIHVSDSHIGTSYYDEVERFEWFFDIAVPVIQPLLIINSGDLVDGSVNGIPASGQEEEEWELYRSIVDAYEVTPDFYYDLPGNHDAYGDENLTFYHDWSLSGTTYGTLTHSIPVTTPFGDYFFYGASTVGIDGQRFVHYPEWYPEELDELETELSNHDSNDLIFVFGHHPPGSPQNSAEALDIIRSYGGFYFHGHTHRYDTYMHEGIITAQVDSLGKSGSENLAVLAVDNNAVTYEATGTDDAWPFILITAPVDRYLLSGEENPYAYDVCESGTENPIRALVFDTATVSAVMVETENGVSSGLTRDPDIPQLWTGTFDATGLSAGEHTLTVTAAGSSVRSHEITIQLADIECPEIEEPEPPEDPDAGVEGDDGGFEDAANSTFDGALHSDAQITIDASLQADGAMSGTTSPSDGCNCSVLPSPLRHNKKTTMFLMGLLLFGLSLISHGRLS